jgi:hypothetical protein
MCGDFDKLNHLASESVVEPVETPIFQYGGIDTLIR